MTMIIYRQPVKFNGRDTILELLPAFNFKDKNGVHHPKFQINIMKYDENKQSGSRISDKIDTYIDVAKFLSMGNDILNGKFFNRCAKGEVYLFQSIGGTTAEKLAAKNKSRADGKGEARVFKINSKSAVWADKKIPKPDDIAFFVSAESGPGETNKDTGGITPAFPNNKAEIKVNIALSVEQLKELALLAQMEYQAWLTAGYTISMSKAKMEAPFIKEF